MRAQCRHEAQRAEPLGKRYAFRAEQAGGEAERRRQPPAAQAEIAGVAHFQRVAQQRFGRHADDAHEPQELGIRADKDVLAVVELVILGHYAPGAPAGHRSRFEHRHPDATLGERDAGRHAGVTAADDRYARIHVFQAIQNLRTGVSDVRCARTRKPSRSISSSSAR